MKLIIQIPCYNEARSLETTIKALPSRIDGIDEIELVVIDDGSDDGSAAVARAAGAIVFSLGGHQGLAAAFHAGLRESLARGADILVNTDADNQYLADDVAALIQPVLSGRADLVVGDRGVGTEEYFSPAKRVLQGAGSWVVSIAAGIKIPDATSGFRAFSRGAAARAIIFSKYSYTLETLIQAAALKQRVAFVPVRTNAPVRPSRLMRSKLEYVRRSALIIVQSFAIYHPFRMLLSSTGLILGIAIAGLTVDAGEIVMIAAIFQSLALLGFVPLYQGHRATLKRAEQQAEKLTLSSPLECAAAGNG